MKEKHPTRFCETCGTLMGWKRKVESYDAMNGKARYTYTFRCLRQTFLKPGHSSITVTPDYTDYSSQSGD